MSLFRDSPKPCSSSLFAELIPPSAGSSSSTSTTSSPSIAPQTKPRSSTASSRNDLFNTSWQPDVPPPPPPPRSALPASGSGTWGSGGHAATMPAAVGRREPMLKMDGQVDEFGMPSSSTSIFNTATVPAPQLPIKVASAKLEVDSPRTSSFFDLSTAGSVTPPPAPRLATTLHSSGGNTFTQTPMTLSRSSSLRKVPPPPLPLGEDPTSVSEVRVVEISPASATGTPSTSSSRQPSGDSYTYTPLSPLHQSPSLPPSDTGLSDWQPPLPPSAEDVELRFSPSSTYLLGEGRYAQVFLAAYKQSRKGKGRARDLLSRPSSTLPNHMRASGHGEQGEEEQEMNEDGNGLVGGSWRLCAAKRLAPDRESQTMGLREAFFLHRLKATPSTLPQRSGLRSRRNRAVSPLRDSFKPTGSVTPPEAGPSARKNGSVYVVKLIAVKEDIEVAPQSQLQSHSHAGQTHARSTSVAIAADGSARTSAITRQRSSTFISGESPVSSSDSQNRPDLSSFPSLPSLAQAIRHEPPAPAVSRLVLLLEHAPLGTLDRMIRTSPQLVGKNLWERWAREGAEALEWVHGKGVVHADVKPGNLLLTTDLHIRLSDFGSSLLIHHDHPPTDGVGLGTLPFSPPELVDPKQTFSFPVDVFALGATLYQCLTGREPFRGVRTIEMMHHVRKGGLWAYEERERLGRIGHEAEASVGGSPYPSAWRQAAHPSGTSSYSGIRRAGSLRVPPSYARPHLDVSSDRPRLNRMTSAESLRASDEASSSESPAGVKLWANWVKNNTTHSSSSSAGPSRAGGPATDAISILLSEDDFAESPSVELARKSSMRRAQEGKLRVQTQVQSQSQNQGHTRRSSASGLLTGSGEGVSPVSTDASPITPISPVSISPQDGPNTNTDTVNRTNLDLGGTELSHSGQIRRPEEETYLDANEAKEVVRALSEPYSDGSPAMLYLNGEERVSEQVREVLRGMLERDQEMRLTAEEVRGRWDELGVGVGVDEV